MYDRTINFVFRAAVNTWYSCGTLCTFILKVIFLSYDAALVQLLEWALENISQKDLCFSLITSCAKITYSLKLDSHMGKQNKNTTKMLNQGSMKVVTTLVICFVKCLTKLNAFTLWKYSCNGLGHYHFDTLHINQCCLYNEYRLITQYT